MNNKQIKHDSVSRTEIHIQLKKYKEIFRTILENYLILKQVNIDTL